MVPSEDMTAQLSELHTTIESLTANQEAMSEELKRRMKWQESISSHLQEMSRMQSSLTRLISQMAEGNKTRDARADEVDAKLATLISLMQTGAAHQSTTATTTPPSSTQGGPLPTAPHPANLVSQTQQEYGTQQPITPPPRQGAGRI